MTTRDKEIIDAILNYIGNNHSLEEEFANFVALPLFQMNDDEFSSWLSKVKVK